MTFKKKSALRVLLVTVAIAFHFQSSSGQSFNFSDYVPASPKSPNAASLGIFGDIPVSLYTGVPDISIPIYTISVSGVNVPISLNYHASGVKVDDYPSWVGTGWALNAGGVINRQQKGIIDEKMIDYYSTFAANVTAINNASATIDETSDSHSMYPGSDDAKYDTESDMFTYSMPGANGKFFFDPQANIYGIPAHKMVISPSARVNPGTGAYQAFFKQWVITDNKGVKYYFGANATNTASTYEVTSSSAACSNQVTPSSSINSWYLAEIALPNGQSIQFNYETYSYCIPQAYNQTEYLDPRIIRMLGSAQQSYINYTTALRLQSIVFPNGKIEFVPGGYRQDLPNDKVLDKVNIYKSLNGVYSLLKTFKIFTNNPSGVIAHSPTDNSATFRMNLDSVVMLASDQSRIGAYSMKYNQGSYSPPGRNSTAQDFWGYFNGQTNNASLIPILYTRGGSDNHITGTIGDANRAADPNYALLDIISSITYPTGGSTYFSFEGNQAVCNDTRLANFLQSPANTPVTKLYLYALDNSDAGNASGYGDEFTIGNILPGGQIHVDGHVLPYGTTGSACAMTLRPSPVNAYENPCYNASLWKKNADGTFSLVYDKLFFDKDYPIDAWGTYKVKIDWTSTAQGRAYCNISWQEYPAASNNTNTVMNVGGLRVQSIVNYDAYHNVLSKKNYSYLKDDGTTSGTISALPVYYFYTPMDFIASDQTIYSDILTVGTTSFSSAFNTSGSGIGYSTVTETIDDGGMQGKTVYRYTSNDPTQTGCYPDAGVIASLSFPFPEPTSYEWRRGNLLSKSTYAYVNNQYSLVDKQTSDYTFLSDVNYHLFQNIKIVKTPFMVAGGSGGVSGQINYRGSYFKYNTITEAFYTNSTSSQTYDSKNYQPGAINWNLNTFDSNALANGNTASPQSNGYTIAQQTTYSIDYNTAVATDDASLGIKNLVTKNFVKLPVEIVSTYKDASGNTFVKGGVLLVYYKDKPLVNKYYKLSLASPIAIASFTASSVNTNGQFVYDSRYELNTSIDAYTTLYDVSQVTRYKGASVGYLWGYNGEYLVAQAVNAKNTDIFYDSFEEGDGNSTVGDAKTGHYSYTGATAYSKALTGLSAGTYTLTYWKKESGVWSLVSNTAVAVSGSTYTISIPSGTQIDDVKFYPSAAEMSTYTYDPLVGVTSMTDAKDQAALYEYDNFQRLMNIKDKNGNIIKNYTYNFAKPSTAVAPPTVYYNAYKSGTFTRNNCGTGYTGQSYTYSVPGATYSSTISQADADQQAQADVDANGQNQANTLGTCLPNSPFIVMTIASSIVDANGHTQNTYKFSAYADASHSTPYNIPTNITINYKETTTVSHSSGTPAPTTTNTNYTIVLTAGNNQVTTGQIDVQYCPGETVAAVSAQSVSANSAAVVSPNVIPPGDTICTQSYLTLLTGTGYQTGGGVE